MAATRGSTGKKKKTLKPVYHFPGKEELQGFLKDNSKFFNLSEMERISGLPNSTLRHICAGSRLMQSDEYKQLKMAVLPKMCEFVLLLQHYD